MLAGPTELLVCCVLVPHMSELIMCSAFGFMPVWPTARTIAASVGLYHNCYIYTNNSLVCKCYWPQISCNSGELNIPPGNYTSVSAGWEFTCALTTAGSIVCT